MNCNYRRQCGTQTYSNNCPSFRDPCSYSNAYSNCINYSLSKKCYTIFDEPLIAVGGIGGLFESPTTPRSDSSGGRRERLGSRGKERCPEEKKQVGRSRSTPPRPPTRRNLNDMPDPLLRKGKKSKDSRPKTPKSDRGKADGAKIIKEDVKKISSCTCNILEKEDSLNSTSSYPDQEYLQFSLRITEDIIRNDLYSHEEMKRVFSNHIDANRNRLNMDKMLAQVDELCRQLGIPIYDHRNDIEGTALTGPLEQPVSPDDIPDKDVSAVVCDCGSCTGTSCLAYVGKKESQKSTAKKTPEALIDCDCETCTGPYCLEIQCRPECPEIVTKKIPDISVSCSCSACTAIQCFGKQRESFKNVIPITSDTASTDSFTAEPKLNQKCEVIEQVISASKNLEESLKSMSDEPLEVVEELNETMSSDDNFPAPKKPCQDEDDVTPCFVQKCRSDCGLGANVDDAQNMDSDQESETQDQLSWRKETGGGGSESTSGESKDDEEPVQDVKIIKIGKGSEKSASYRSGSRKSSDSEKSQSTQNSSGSNKRSQGSKISQGSQASTASQESKGSQATVEAVEEVSQASSNKRKPVANAKASENSTSTGRSGKKEKIEADGVIGDVPPIASKVINMGDKTLKIPNTEVVLLTRNPSQQTVILVDEDNSEETECLMIKGPIYLPKSAIGPNIIDILRGLSTSEGTQQKKVPQKRSKNDRSISRSSNNSDKRRESKPKRRNKK